MGRAGIEPATLGLKVLQISTKYDLKKHRFGPLFKPFPAVLGRLSGHIVIMNL
jgi:hypothetical protein